MFNSIKYKIITPVAVILVLLVVAIVLFVSVAVSNLSNYLMNYRVQGAVRSVVTQLDNLEEKARIVATSVADSATVSACVANWNTDNDKDQNRQTLIAYLTAAAKKVDTDSFVVHDVKGDVILRLHEPEKYGDSDIHLPFVAAALKGQPSDAYAQTETMPMGIVSTSPIRYEGEVIGSLTVLVLIHTEAFVDKYAEIFDAQITIFAGKNPGDRPNTRVMTTFKDAKGQRTIGTEQNDERVLDAVLNKGENYPVEVTLFGERYHATYLPLSGFGGTPAGMFFLGFSKESTIAAANVLLRNVIIIGATGLLVAVFIVLVIAGRISKPITVIAEFMKQAGSTGNITMHQECVEHMKKTSQTKDEVGQLCNAISMFVHHVTRISEELETVAQGDLSVELEILSDKDVLGASVKHMIDSLNKSFSDINRASDRVATGSGEVLSTSQTLSNGAQESAASLEQISASMSEISSQTRSNAESASQARDLAQETSKVAGEGQDAMKEMTTAMERITQNSNEIQRVIKVIDDIAFQTNLLALNAAVEAARAGQHGKGFAVVAEEVRNLARESNEAAEKIAKLVTDASKQINSGAALSQKLDSMLVGIMADAKKQLGES